MDRRACWLGCMALWAARGMAWAQARPRLIAVLNATGEIEGPDRFELASNGSTARVIGATIPQSLLLCADEGIE